MLFDTPFALFGVESEDIFTIDNLWSRGTIAEDAVCNESQSEIILLFMILYLAFPPLFVRFMRMYGGAI